MKEMDEIPLTFEEAVLVYGVLIFLRPGVDFVEEKELSACYRPQFNLGKNLFEKLMEKLETRIKAEYGEEYFQETFSQAQKKSMEMMQAAFPPTYTGAPLQSPAPGWVSAPDLASLYGKNLVGKKVETAACGDWSGGICIVTEVAHDPKAPEIVFVVRHVNTHEEMGIFDYEWVRLLP